MFLKIKEPRSLVKQYSTLVVSCKSKTKGRLIALKKTISFYKRC